MHFRAQEIGVEVQSPPTPAVSPGSQASVTQSFIQQIFLSTCSVPDTVKGAAGTMKKTDPIPALSHSLARETNIKCISSNIIIECYRE